MRRLLAIIGVATVLVACTPPQISPPVPTVALLGTCAVPATPGWVRYVFQIHAPGFYWMTFRIPGEPSDRSAAVVYLLPGDLYVGDGVSWISLKWAAHQPDDLRLSDVGLTTVGGLRVGFPSAECR